MAITRRTLLAALPVLPFALSLPDDEMFVTLNPVIPWDEFIVEPEDDEPVVQYSGQIILEVVHDG